MVNCSVAKILEKLKQKGIKTVVNQKGEKFI